MSHKKKSEGIDLLSIYGDEDDDMEDIADEEENRQNDNTSSTPQTVTSTPQQSQLQVPAPSPPPPQQTVTTDMITISRTSGLTIVDYTHDELVAEDGKLVAASRVTFGAEIQADDGELPVITSPGTVQIQKPNGQSSEQNNQSQSDPMIYAVTESESVEIEESIKISTEEPKEIDPLDKFLPPPPEEKCSDELQEKIIKFLSLKKTTGRSFNAEVRNRKEYRNPDFLLHAVTYQDIDQIGSCFSKDVFDPHGYDKSDFYDEIEADLKREMERKEQEKKKSPKVEYVSGGTLPGNVIPSPKVNILPIQANPDVAAREGRQNKKSKWDKVDTDRRNPLPPSGGQDSASVHTAMLSASNTTGYAGFAQQKRREAEEKRSSGKKFERRS